MDEPGDVAVAKTLWPAQSAGTKPQDRGSNPSQPSPARSWMSQGAGQSGQYRQWVPLRFSVDPSARHPIRLPPRGGLRRATLLGGVVTEARCVLAVLLNSRRSNMLQHRALGLVFPQSVVTVPHSFGAGRALEETR